MWALSRHPVGSCVVNVTMYEPTTFWLPLFGTARPRETGQSQNTLQWRTFQQFFYPQYENILDQARSRCHLPLSSLNNEK